MRNAIKLGDKVELVTEVTLANQPSRYFSKVQEVDDETSVVIIAPTENGWIEPLELNRKYGMSVYTDKGLYRCEAMLSKRVKTEHHHLITLDILTTLQKYQRRQFFRINCGLTFQYKDDVNQEWYEGMILDISGGGIRFTTKSKLESNRPLMSHIRLNWSDDDEEELFLAGMMIESAPTELDKTVYENRVEFEGIDYMEREIIIKFIFEEERRYRKGRKGM